MSTTAEQSGLVVHVRNVDDPAEARPSLCDHHHAPDGLACQTQGGLEGWLTPRTATRVWSSTMPYGGRGLFMGVHKATRTAAGVAVGDEVDIFVTRDETPRVLELAPELEAALAAEPGLRARLEMLSFSRRRELADPVTEARRPETRAARVEKALARLRELG